MSPRAQAKPAKKAGSAPQAGSASQAVLIVGSGYGALKVAEDLSHSGVPVTWLTGAGNFLELPAGVKPEPEWPEDLAFQFRPLYLRVTRHPLVTPLTRARLASLKKTPAGYHAMVEQDPTFIDYDLCTGCRRCVETCPLAESQRPPLRQSPDWCPSRALELTKLTSPPCRQACPLGVNAQAYLALTAAGRLAEALAVVRRDNPLPGVCGRVCHHPCEASCRRGELDKPLAIRDLKRFLFDAEAAGGEPVIAPPAERRGLKAAVIGSGPAGLTAAHFLNQAGVSVTVLEEQEAAGGMLRLGINAFRLPRAVLDAEIKALADSGIEIVTGRPVGSLDKLFAQGFSAVILATGTHQDLRLNLPGEDLAGVEHCLGFLGRVNRGQAVKAGRRTLVIGGGNSAMDAARTALRLGAEKVTVLAIEDEATLPAHPRETREAREEGVEFRLGLAPVALEGSGRVRRVLARPAHWEAAAGGPPRIVFDSDQAQALEVDLVVVAIGQRPHLTACGLADQVELGPGGRVRLGEDLATSRAGVFAAGDVVTGPSTVVGAMAGGRRAAERALAFLEGRPWRGAREFGAGRGTGEWPAIGEDEPQKPRQEPAQRQPKARRRDFGEVDLGLTLDQAQAEARRCLQCATCCECRACEEACAEIGAIDHFRAGRRFTLESPAVIVADEAALPPLTEEVRAGLMTVGSLSYGPDLLNNLMAGTVAAGRAMALSHRLRLPAELDEPEYEPAARGRLGFFLCACNQTMAPPAVLEGIMAQAAAAPEVLHAQMVVSVCQGEGADQIARAVKRQRLARVILASCVCCPLNFHCISCNDQRTRARHHLFESLKLKRCSFETINLRDHLHAGAQDETALIERARDLLRAAFIRSRFLGPLRSGATEMGKRVLILGGSEAGVAAAQNLARQGLSVRLLHKGRLGGQELPPEVAARPVARDLGPGVTAVDEAEIVEVGGHLGDFTVAAISDGRKRRWQADVLCVTDFHLVPLTIYAGQVGLKKFYRYDFAFFNTPQMGVYRLMPKTLERVSPAEAGAALAAEVATSAAKALLNDHQLSPWVDPTRCRGCGRCAEICPFDAVTMKPNPDGSYRAEVLRYNCVGCGGCVGRCPVTALDMPYFSNRLLEEMVAGVLGAEGSR